LAHAISGFGRLGPALVASAGTWPRRNLPPHQLFRSCDRGLIERAVLLAVEPPLDGHACQHCLHPFPGHVSFSILQRFGALAGRTCNLVPSSKPKRTQQWQGETTPNTPDRKPQSMNNRCSAVTCWRRSSRPQTIPSPRHISTRSRAPPARAFSITSPPRCVVFRVFRGQGV